MNKYCTISHARELSGCVAYVLFNSKEKYNETTIFDKVVSLSQMEGLLSDPEWVKWAEQIVYSAYNALTFYPVELKDMEQMQAEYDAMNY